MAERSISEIFAERLDRIFDTSHGLQKEIADAIGISPSRLNNIVKGRRGSDEDLRRAICRILKVDYDEFVFGRKPECDIVSEDDQELRAFLDLYRQYGSPAFIQSCIDKLEKIKMVIEDERPPAS